MNISKYLLSQIIDHEFWQSLISAEQIVGKGSVNQVFVCTTGQWVHTVRLNDYAGAQQEFLKEQRCIQQASTAGIDVSSNVKVWTLDTIHYLIYDYISWSNGNESDHDPTQLRYTLGQITKKLHSIPVQWYGIDFLDTSNAHASSRVQHLTYNIDSLWPHDQLRTLGVIDVDTSDRVKQIFLGLQSQQFTFGLTHNDISLKNLIVWDDGLYYLIDRWCAEVNITPYFEFVEIVERHLDQDEPWAPDRTQLDAFYQWYGLTISEINDLPTKLAPHILLKTVDKLRRAIDRSPDDIAKYTALVTKRIAYAKELLRK